MKSLLIAAGAVALMVAATGARADEREHRCHEARERVEHLRHEVREHPRNEELRERLRHAEHEAHEHCHR